MSRLVDTEDLLMDILFVQRPSIISTTIPSPPTPWVGPMIGCGCLHLFQSGAGWTLSEGNYAKLLSESITK